MICRAVLTTILITGAALAVPRLWAIVSPESPSEGSTDVDSRRGPSPRRTIPGSEGKEPPRRASPRVLPRLEPSFQDLKSRAEDLSSEGLAEELAELDGQIVDQEWVARANENRLSQSEKRDFAVLLRRRNALAAVRALRQVSALEGENSFQGE